MRATTAATPAAVVSVYPHYIFYASRENSEEMEGGCKVPSLTNRANPSVIANWACKIDIPGDYTFHTLLEFQSRLSEASRGLTDASSIN